MIKILIFTLELFLLQASSCVNSTNIKYELTQQAHLMGYFSTCFQFSERTCCSTNNVDNLRKRISKFFVNKQSTSQKCRQAITSLMCSLCDGDIGTARKSGICESYCNNIYAACSNDFFILEAGDKLRVCQQQDPVCSKLQHILPIKTAKVCEYLGFQIRKSQEQLLYRGSCWAGEISSQSKGNSPNKIKYSTKVTPNQDRQYDQSWLSDISQNLLISILCIVGVTAVIIKCIRL